MEPPLTWAVATIMAILSVVTVIGNLAVLLSYYLDKNIRQPANFFIFSLAVSDLVITVPLPNSFSRFGTVFYRAAALFDYGIHATLVKLFSRFRLHISLSSSVPPCLFLLSLPFA